MGRKLGISYVKAFHLGISETSWLRWPQEPVENRETEIRFLGVM